MTFARRIHPQQPLQDHVAFIHIPKCAGTSVTDAISAHVPLLTGRGAGKVFIGSHVEPEALQFAGDDPLGDALRQRNLLLRDALERSTARYLVGHFAFDGQLAQRWQDRWQWVTVLRDPVKRWLSEFTYNRSKNSGHFRHDLDLDTFAESTLGQASGYRMTSMLAGRPGSSRGTAADVKAAIRNLRDFAVVGVLEDLNGFANRFQARFRVALEIPHSNPTKIARFLGPGETKKVHELCAPDIELYEATISMLRE